MNELESAVRGMLGRVLSGDAAISELDGIPTDRLSPAIAKLYTATLEDHRIHGDVDGARMIGGSNGSHKDMDVLMTAIMADAPHLEEARAKLFEALVNATRSNPDSKPDPLPSPVEDVEQFSPTDYGNAELLVAMFGNDLRYDHSQKRWLVWNGISRWRPDTDGVTVRLASQVARQRLISALEIDDPEKRKKALQWAMSSMSGNAIKNILFLAQHLLPITDEGKGWDETPNILGADNAVIDLITGEPRPGRREDRLTMSTGCNFDPDARCPRFEQFLEEIFEANAELISFIHRLAGYTITGTLREEIFLLAHGKGQNGKSKLMSAFQAALGDYAGEISFVSLEAQRRRSGEATPDLATLPGKRFVSASEGRGEARWDERRVKSLTGRDRVVCRAMYRGQISFEPRCVFWLSTNHRPCVEDTTESFWRRIILIPFSRYFSPEERDPDLQNKLAAEKEGILAWMVRGALAYQERGLDPPEIVLAATKKYRSDEDRVSSFLDDATVRDKSAKVTKGDLYNAYVAWASKSGEPILRKKSFGTQISDTDGISEGYLGGARAWEGIRLAAKYEQSPELGLNGRERDQEEIF